VNEYVELPLVSKLLAEADESKPPEKVVMREEYIEFLHEWLQSPEGYGKMLVGSPGIGKSVCSYVALEYKLREPSPGVVVWMWDKKGGGSSIFMLCGGTVYWTESYASFKRWLSTIPQEARQNFTFVYDGRENLHYMAPPPFTLGLAVHSPSADSLAGTEKEGLWRWYMKAWERSEIEQWAVLQGHDLELTRKVYDRLGGNVREVERCFVRGNSVEVATATVEDALEKLFR